MPYNTTTNHDKVFMNMVRRGGVPLVKGGMKGDMRAIIDATKAKYVGMA